MKTVTILLTTVAVAFAASKPFNIFAYSHQELAKNDHELINRVPSFYPHPSLRIIHGNEATPHSIPHQAFIRFTGASNHWFCGGALITPKYVLTAGECTINSFLARVILGAHNVFEREKTQQVRNCYEPRTHENYKPGDLRNNLGLIELDRAAEINAYVRPIRLPKNSKQDFTGQIVRVSGWGSTAISNGNLSKVLNYIDDRVISNKECQKVYPKIDGGEICTSGEDGKAICTGDGGDPATVGGVLVGIAITTDNLCTGGYPIGFTRTSEYLNWIRLVSDY